MSFRELLIDEVIKPVIQAQPRLTTGIVIAYSKEHNVCSVQLGASTTMSSVSQTLIQVPVAVVNSLNACGPFPGQQVLIEFLDGQPNNPVVIGIIDHAYQGSVREGYQVHEKQGAYLCDTISRRQFRWSRRGPGWGA